MACDGAYRDLLIKARHRDDRLAPPFLRMFVEHFEPSRFSFSQGIDNKDGSLSFWWFMDGFSLKGEAGDVMASVMNYWTEASYKRLDDREDGRMCFEYEEDKILFTFEMNPFVNYTGGPGCGGSVFFRLTILTYLQEPDVKTIQKLYPPVACQVLPRKLEKELEGRLFKSISFGGTWENYYTWNLDVKCPDEAEAESLGKTLTRLLIEAGYKFVEERESTRTFNFSDAFGTSFFYLTNDGSNILGLRFQPNS